MVETPKSPPRLTFKILSQQNAETSNSILDQYADSSSFDTLAEVEGEAILKRDQEDDEKLEKGIEYAKSKGVIDPNFVPEPYMKIDVLGKKPDDVCDQIITEVDKNKENNGGAEGSVIVICGLSGTGKGTTVAKLQQKLETTGEDVVCWSNGNIFRSVTLLAVKWCEQQEECDDFDAEKALTKERIASYMSMLKFGKFKGKFDTRINGLGLNMLVSEVQNTDLKAPKVSKQIPTVAQVTQGEVILFAADAIHVMCTCGITVLLEGREQTVNYVRTPLRFTLELSDKSLIGKRRAAQRLMAVGLSSITEDCNEDQIKVILDNQLSNLLKEAGIAENIHEDEDDEKAHGRGLFCFKLKWRK